AIWSFSDKNESSAMIKPLFTPGKPLTDDDLTPVGLWVKDLVRGQNPDEIVVHDTPESQNTLSYKLIHLLSSDNLRTFEEWPKAARIVLLALIALSVLFVITLAVARKKYKTYTRSYESVSARKKHRFEFLFSIIRGIVLVSTLFFSMLYLYWRIRYSIPTKTGVLAIICNIILLVVELFGFFESIVLYSNLISLRSFSLPEIADSEYPEVDIFIATYNEPTDLLKKTINACNHLKYPDKSKVHIWVCDDNRRKEMRDLAQDMHVGYFDRPDNKGAKAGNLNHAMSLTNSPLVVTLDADMIVKSDFLLKTVPYFVQARKDGVKLGLLQTPQCFYEPDIFQYSLYSEKSAPNEQDFFYRTIEVAKTSTNSVIYGGSNTVLLRQALEDAGGFYTGSITEDFATGLLIESKGYVSLGLSEPLASGKTPGSFKEHIKQRMRWGRGVISTARKLHIARIKGLSIFQKLSYWSSVSYWYSPIKNLVYMTSPLLFALLSIPVFQCTLTDLLLFWLPMFIMQDICLRVYSQNAISLKWTGIYETSVMPFLLIPVLKELFGISTSSFAVTDKSGKVGKKERDYRSMVPFLILIVLSVIGLIRMLFLIDGIESLGFVILGFWILRNLYLLIMSLFLVDGRKMEAQDVEVVDADLASITAADGTSYDGITTSMSEHSVKIYLDEAAKLGLGDRVNINVEHNGFSADVSGVITAVTRLKNSEAVVYSAEILDYNGNENEYYQVLFDRIPTLPQSLTKDFGIFTHMLKIIAHRVLD
ncbi:MAG: glycosyltransferase, partial [Lachnospiraceae bacterium]|nr:glycosyltransferase [Lachnospiraceae bacterium]